MIGGDASQPSYAPNALAPLQAISSPDGTAAPALDVPEAPLTAPLPVVALAVFAGTILMRRRRAATV